ncbi:hypothetical protein [Pseudomonas chlororaphis]|uniref:hypothetical protein n=1 Tax=Pseudomonas chlororaphis TaxID=587753 RepID=UPI0015DDCEC8|nr:hypothetical protein [Pseudomonas chlororaphis]QLL10698.1 hypothetical protein H0I86_16650 [Pseudomonas chlororaphis subsp. aurantiaca]
MFRTYDWAEAVTIELFDEDFRVWTYVEYDVGGAWFHVQIEERSGSIAKRFNLMISGDLALRALLARQSKKLVIIEVQLVSANELNQGGRQLMEPLIKAETVFEGRKKGTIYHVENGNCYLVGNIDLERVKPEERDVIFDLSMLLKTP